VATSRQIDRAYGGLAWRPGRPRRQFVSSDDPVESAMAVIDEVRPQLVVGYGSYLELLFRTVVAKGGLRHRPLAIRYGADAMSDEGRAEIEDRLGVPVLSTYAAAESLRLGYLCEERDGFHLHDDLVHVTIVDAAGEPLPDGVAGEVVITNLVNRATVLLNYRLGDVARIDASPCHCGRTSRRLAGLVGRVTDVIALANGGVVFTDAIWGCVKHRPEVVRFQLVEVAPLVFELRLRTLEGSSFADAAADVGARTQALLGGAEVTTVADPTLGDGGDKFRPVVLLPRV
jgi:phenylacetate-CoA ligase